MKTVEIIEGFNGGMAKAWIKYVPLDGNAIEQVRQTSDLPFIFKHVAVMPDAHYGVGSTVGSVIPTKNAIIPAAVGVDIGCGMIAARLSISASNLPDNLAEMRSRIESTVPTGFSNFKEPQNTAINRWSSDLSLNFNKFIANSVPGADEKICLNQLGTLGSGNHFIELCIDEEQRVWIMLHSGSRGIGNKIGSHYISLAKTEMDRLGIKLPSENLSYFTKESQHFDDYFNAVFWAQEYAKTNREIMLFNTLNAVRKFVKNPHLAVEDFCVQCHHNYVSLETHFNEEVYITRKGAIKADKGVYGIIPGSMGAKSFIVKGLGNEESFCSCSHGAGRVMSRGEAKKLIDLDDHERDTQGVECKKDMSVIDESPRAYKNIDSVMKSQEDLVEIVHTLKQVLCVKG
jgi:tRNA-splicing ligase RtcB